LKFRSSTSRPRFRETRRNGPLNADGRGGSGAEQAREAQREIIHAFMEHGVSPALKDAKGKSVLDWARSDGIREMLTSYGA